MKNKLFHSRVGSFVFFALAVCAFFFLRSASFAHGWMAEVYFAAFVPMMQWVIACVAVLLVVYMLLPLAWRERKLVRIVHLVFCVLAGVLFGYSAQILFSLGWPIQAFTYQRGWAEFAPNLVYVLAVLVLPFAWLVMPVLKRRSRTVIAVAASAVMVVVLLAPHIANRAQPLAMETLPLVLDIGDDNYSVVFVSTRRATAHLQFELYGETVTLASAEDGRLRTGRIHNVIVPREQLNGNSYRIILREVLLSVDSGVEFGATYHSRDFQFRGEFVNEPNILVSTDLHNLGHLMIEAATHFEDEPDLFIMLGDMSSGVNNEQRLIRYIIGFGGEVTRGEIPAIFARGNHEMYGDYTEIIRPGLGMPSFYFQTRRGDILFTVLDGADAFDVPLDFTPHVRGTANSWNDVFRQEQLDWLAMLEPGDETLHFALIHRPEFGNAEQRDAYFAHMQRLGVHMQFSGDTHRLALELPGQPELRFNAPFPLITAGGPTQGYGGNMICTVALVCGNTVRLIAYDNTGHQHMNETVPMLITDEYLTGG